MTPPEIFGRVQACPKRQASSDSCFPYGHCPRVGQSVESGTATDQQRRLQSAPGASLRQRPLLAAGSTDRCNTFCELLSLGLIEQGLSRSFIELPCYRAELCL